jgi:hypothetical protein
MRTRGKKKTRFTLEHIGRELGKFYPPADTPNGLRALFTEGRRRATRCIVMTKVRTNEGDRNPK